VKALVWRAVDEIGLVDYPEPWPGDEVIVKVHYTGICGSDITIKSGKHPRARIPLVLGHEFMGTISYLPERHRGRLAEGQRVAVNPLISCKTCRPCRAGHEHVCEKLQLIGVERNPGAFTEYVSVPQAERIHPLPDNVSDEEGALVEPLAVAVHAVKTAGLRGGETVAILGAGPIGLLVASAAASANAGTILISEIDDERLKMAARLKVATIDAKKSDPVEEIKKATDGCGADVVFDAAGVPESASQVIPMAAIKGKVVMVAIHKKTADVAFRDLAYKELTIAGTRIYAKGDFEDAIALLAEGRVDVKPLVTHIFPMKEAVEAFELVQRSTGACKVLIRQDY
jgi:2-desacetyl-2-hydroxyethyl bacteriochlorophyllide A dehydrogenase